MSLAFIGTPGPLELVIVLVVVLVIFGPKRLPSLARSVGGGMREFKDSLTGKSDDEVREEAAALEPSKPAPAAATTPVHPPAAVAAEAVEGEPVREPR